MGTEVEINEGWWTASSGEYDYHAKMWTVFHELGHCALDYQPFHNSLKGTGPNGESIPLSVMSSTAGNGMYLKDYYDAYMKELFTRSLQGFQDKGVTW